MNDENPNPLLDARVEAERSLIGSAFIAPQETRQTCGWLKPEAFWLEVGRQFWSRFIAGDDALEIAVDMNLLADVAGWGNDLPSAMYGSTYARKVAEGAHLQEVERLSLQIAEASHGGNYGLAKELTDRLTALQPHAHNGARNWFDVSCSFIEALEADVRSITTGIVSLDKAIAGLERQTESVIAARPSQGKSTLALQIAMHAAKCDKRVLFVSLEMSEINLFARAACPLVGVTWLDVRRGVVSPGDIARLKDAAADMGSAYAPNLFVYDKRATTETVWELAQTHRADLVFVDHLRKLGDRPELSEVKRLGWITNRTKDMAKQLNLHACMLVQLNRGADADANNAPELRHLRDSGEIEEDADLVMMLHGKPVNEIERAKPTRDTDLWIRKARDGVRDAKVELRFNLRTQAFAGRAND
jgi:replicative DNA helicase